MFRCLWTLRLEVRSDAIPEKEKRGKTGFILVIKQPFRYHRKYSIILVLVCMQTHSLIEIDQCLICELQIHNSGRKHTFYSFTAVYEHCRHIGLLTQRLLGRLQLLVRGEALFVIQESFLILISFCLSFIYFRVEGAFQIQIPCVNLEIPTYSGTHHQWLRS